MILQQYLIQVCVQETRIQLNHGLPRNVETLLGKGFGAFLGGPLIEIYGGAATFRMFAISAIVFLVLYVIAQKFWVQTGNKTLVVDVDNKKGMFS